MSDTDKCPKCGAELKWREPCGRQYAYCVCGWTPDETKDIGRYPNTRQFPVSAGLLHRIRELEAQNARLRETVANKDNAIFSLSTELQYFKEKHQRVLAAYEGEVRRLREAQGAQNARLTEALMRVQEMAHNASSGPMEPDTYWDIRAIAQEALK